MIERAGSNDVFRTPDDRFEGLPDFEYQPQYRDVDGLRLAHIDVGEGPPILMIHGEPAWSFVWRKLIPQLVGAGYRCIAMDLAGCGRSDKPSDPGWYSMERHIEQTRSLLSDLDLRDLTLVLHDWGGMIGLTLAVAERDRVARAVILDTALDPSDLWMSQRWVEFREFVERTEDLPVGWVMRATLHNEPEEGVIAAYNAPYLGPESKVALRALPLSIERTERTPEGSATLIAALRADPRPFHIIWGENDTILTATTAQRFAASIGRQVDEWIPAAGHGLPEDQGELLGERIVAWLGAAGPSS